MQYRYDFKRPEPPPTLHNTTRMHEMASLMVDSLRTLAGTSDMHRAFFERPLPQKHNFSPPQGIMVAENESGWMICGIVFRNGVPQFYLTGSTTADGYYRGWSVYTRQLCAGDLVRWLADHRLTEDDLVLGLRRIDEVVRRLRG